MQACITCKIKPWGCEYCTFKPDRRGPKVKPKPDKCVKCGDPDVYCGGMCSPCYQQSGYKRRKLTAKEGER